MASMTVAVKTEDLLDIPALETRYNGKFLRADIDGDTAIVTLLPVLADWYVNVWDCRASLIIETEGGQVDETELAGLDSELLAKLKERVIEECGGSITLSGRYYPQSAESIAMFRRLTGAYAGNHEGR